MLISKILSVLATAILISYFASSSFVPLVHSQSFVVPCTIETYGNAWEGELAFGLWQPPTATSYLVIMKTSGELEYSRRYDDLSYIIVKNIAPNTIMFMGEPVLGVVNVAPLNPTHFWNYVSNTTIDFPDVRGHHDIVYNPINNTFLTLQDYVRTVNGTDYLYDKIVELTPTGNVLWSWDTYDYIPLNQADPFNPTAIVNGATVQDFTHANSLDWDYNNSIIYLNCRHTNTFYKINQTTGTLVWSCGEHGDFTLLSENGTMVSSLWYHSHSNRQVEPSVFIMFDNDFDNETNPNNCRSRMIEVTVNEQNMTAWVSWSWSAPTQYWTPFWGKTDRLPNGDRIGTFGSHTHQFPQNQPWTFDNTGAVLVEVNPEGQVVRTYTFPAGWGIYRIEEMNINIIPKVTTPVFSPAGGTYSSTQNITLSCSTVGASIKYTTDGSEPNSSSALYSSPISISSATTVKAKAFMNGITDSDTAQATYTINLPPPKVSTPTFSPPGGTYSSSQSVSISTASVGAAVRYTTDGSEPSSSSTTYSSPISVSVTTTIKAKASKDGMIDSDTAMATYSITTPEPQPSKVSTPTFSPSGGTYGSAQNVVLSCATSGATIRYTVDGSEPSSSSAVYSSPISVNGSTTIKAKASMAGMTDSNTASATYTINIPKVATPTFSPVGGSFSTSQSVVIQCDTSGAVIRYTTSGIDPSSSSPVYSVPISVSINTTIMAKGFKGGMANSNTASATYTISAGSQETLSGNTFVYAAIAIVTVVAVVGAVLFYLSGRRKPH